VNSRRRLTGNPSERIARLAFILASDPAHPDSLHRLPPCRQRRLYGARSTTKQSEEHPELFEPRKPRVSDDERDACCFGLPGRQSASGGPAKSSGQFA
jgi:hypothetical protein